MSNTQAPNGFVWERRIDGAEPNCAFNMYPILYTESSQIGFGDPVLLNSSGYLDIAANGTLMLGIFIGCEYIDSINGKQYQKAWTAPSTAVIGTVYGKVIDDPRAVFVAQAGASTSTGITSLDLGSNIEFAGAGTPNSAGISVAYLNVTTISTTNTLAFRIVGLGKSPKNDVTAAYDYAEVMMNYQAYNTTTGV